jgi:hypothetical protein
MEPPASLVMWVVYRSPSDYPGKFVVRRWSIADALEPELKPEGVVDTLEEARDLIPPGLVCLDRLPSDDPVIKEVWF